MHDVNGSIGQEAAVVCPGRSTIPEEVYETKQNLYVWHHAVIYK